MRSLPELVQAAEYPNVAAFLRVIREGESNQAEEAFRMIVFGGHFDSFDDHPRIHKHIVSHEVVRDWKALPYKTSSAAGAFQITETTWDDFCKALELGKTPFTPENQVLCAVWLLDRAKALEDVIAGRVNEAIRKLGSTWTSLSLAKVQAKAEQVFKQYGGILESDPLPSGDLSRISDPPSPQEIKPMGVLAALLPSILQMLPQLIPVLSKGHDSDEAKAWQGAGMVVANTLQTATNTDNLVQAVAAMQKDPAALAAASAAVNEILPQLAEGGGGGIEGARKFAADHESGRYGRILEVVSYSALGFLGVANAMAFAIGWFKGDWGRMEAVTQADIGVGLMVFGFFLGSSVGSRSKDSK